MRGQIFHLERWTTNFKNTDVITKLVVWAHLPRVSVQYKEEKIIKDITWPIGRVIKVDELTFGLNGLFVKVLLEVDLRFPLKRMLIVNHEDDYLILISYEKNFEVCFYCRRMRLKGHVCTEIEADDECFMVDKVFEDEPSVYLEDVVMDEDIKASLQEDVMLCFPNATNVEEDYTEMEESGQCMEDTSYSSRDERSYRDVVSSPKPKRAGKSKERDQQGEFRKFCCCRACDAEATSMSAKPTIGMLSPRKRIREEDVAEAGPSTYLYELD
ncbi:hypothetical protein D8674_004385 [Pyrus ussuriensis x Pyrus communis]|uniref:Uncharacterized protein n=1 Tax=Pyrus ussuriensis x Pyrus communis TaxID=2448454 RepID=A0A5N5FPX0_9ROSA|nr:hypothetical protein D8674_004385 [Pyrus ussuriensis x Pyrus communis]